MERLKRLLTVTPSAQKPDGARLSPAVAARSAKAGRNAIGRSFASNPLRLGVRTAEWYNFQSNPRGTVHVLATLDETSDVGGTMGFDHPIAWCHAYDGGRAWHTAGGHTPESFSEPLFLAHLLGAEHVRLV